MPRATTAFTRRRTVGTSAIATLGLLLVGVLVGSLIADVYTVPDVPCEKSGGDICVLFRFTASDLTRFLLLAVLGWLGVAVGFVLARPEALHGSRRQFASAPAWERRAATAAALASAVVLVATVVLVSG